MKETDLIDEKALKMCKEKRYEKCECNKKKGEAMIKLTEVQIAELDAILTTRKSLKEVFESAMTFYSEKISPVSKNEADWWEKIAKEHGMDIHGKKWRVSMRDRMVHELEEKKK